MLYHSLLEAVCDDVSDSRDRNNAVDFGRRNVSRRVAEEGILWDLCQIALSH
jgi:hypothetical protein